MYRNNLHTNLLLIISNFTNYKRELNINMIRDTDFQ